MKALSKVKLTPILLVSLYVIGSLLLELKDSFGIPSASLFNGFAIMSIIGILVILGIERVIIRVKKFKTSKIWLTEILLLATIPLFIFTRNYIPPTPSEYRNQLTFERTDLSDEFLEIKQVIEERADSVKWPYSRHFKEDANIENEFLFGYFDSTNTKAAFVVIMSAPIEDFKSTSDKEIGYNGAAFRAMKDSVGIWRLNYDQEVSSLWGAWDKKGVIKHYKRIYLRKIQQIELGEQRYNYDDIRAFETHKFDPVYFDRWMLR